MKIPRVSSANVDTLETWDLVEELQHPIPDGPFSTINDTHHTVLRNLAELFNIIPKVTDQQSTNSHNGRRCEVEKEPRQARLQVIHKYTTRQQKNQAPNPRVNTQTRKYGITPRVARNEAPMDTPKKKIWKTSKGNAK